MASSTGAALFVVLVICSSAVSSVSASIDGRPRPLNFPDQPTVTYDNTPVLVDGSGLPVDCIWYGFANSLYDAATTTSCLQVLRMALTNATVNPPSSMKPYLYYTLKRLEDPSNNQSYCYQGCFNLGGSISPSPAAGAPPPLVFGVPPSSSFSPAPSVYPGASPSGLPIGAVPPASISNAPGGAPLSGVTGGPAASPPSPPIGPVVNSGPFLQPATLFSFLVAFAAVFVNFAA